MQPCIIDLFKYLKVGTIASCFGICQSGDTVRVLGTETVTAHTEWLFVLTNLHVKCNGR